MRLDAHHVFGVRQLENALRSARSGQPAREPGSLYLQSAPSWQSGTGLGARVSFRMSSSSGDFGGPGTAQTQKRPQTAPFRVSEKLKWETASAGGRTVRFALGACQLC
jgi:hypothetical protein